MAYGAPFGEINWGRPCQWGGPQGACSASEGGGGAVDAAFPVEWPPDSDSPDDHANSVGPSASVSRDFDVSGVANNSAIIMRLSLLWFQLTGDGILNLFYDMVILAFRDDNGDLYVDTTCVHATIVQSVNGINLFDVDEIKAHDNDTIRIKLKNLQAEDAIVYWRNIFSAVAAGNPILPPPP